MEEKQITEKIRDMKGEKNPMYGVHRFGDKSPHYGKKHNLATKEILSQKRKEWHKFNVNPMKGKTRPDLVLRNKQNKGKRFSKEINTRKGLKGEKNPNWQGGIARLPYPFEFTIIKPKIKNRDKFCQICGKQGNYIHHIDYDKINCNHLNLITLCCSCHSKTNYNRRYWQDLLMNFVSHKDSEYNEVWEYTNIPLQILYD